MQTKLIIGPPPSPNRKEFPFVGTTRLHGLKIDIENFAGSTREGKDPSGKTWRTKMKYHYGEIRGTRGVDQDKLDVYIGPKISSTKVFVVHQNHIKPHPQAGKFDEDKVMMGFDTIEEAKEAYLAQYDRKDFFRSITEIDLNKFRKMIQGENKGEKVAHYTPANIATPSSNMSLLKGAYSRGIYHAIRYNNIRV